MPISHGLRARFKLISIYYEFPRQRMFTYEPWNATPTAECEDRAVVLHGLGATLSLLAQRSLSFAHAAPDSSQQPHHLQCCTTRYNACPKAPLLHYSSPPTTSKPDPFTTTNTHHFQLPDQKQATASRGTTVSASPAASVAVRASPAAFVELFATDRKRRFSRRPRRGNGSGGHRCRLCLTWPPPWPLLWQISPWPWRAPAMWRRSWWRSHRGKRRGGRLCRRQSPRPPPWSFPCRSSQWPLP